MPTVLPPTTPTAPAAAPTPPETTPSAVLQDQVEESLRARMDRSITKRRTHSGEWKRNVEARLGRGAATSLGATISGATVTMAGTSGLATQTELNPDWSLTKTKTANLYSQVPTVYLTHENKQYAAAIPPFAKSLNYEIGEKRAHLGTAMEEVLNDAVNASGIAGIMVGYAARFDYPEVPAIDTLHIPPQLLQTLLASKRIPMKKVPRVISDKFFGTRISPTDLLVPAEFTGSNFDDGDWIGATGRCSWPEAVHEFKLTEEQKARVVATAEFSTQDSLRSEDEGRNPLADATQVTYHDLYYWRHKVDPNELSFQAIWRLVFVEGLSKAVVHEPWKGQRYMPTTRRYAGAVKFPIRILTLTYITDHAIPPSDTSAGRPQVNDLRRSRSQMFQNRERSIPIRWGDVNRIDPVIMDLLMHGTWQGIIPTNGDGSRVLGEVARASYPAENLGFDEATKQDLMETWQVGPNQLGTTQPGRRTAGEVGITQQNFSTRMGQERARVASFFLGVCEVMAGLMALYSDFPILTPEERQTMQQTWDSKQILHDLVFKIRPDTQIVLDTSQRLERIFTFVNMTAKSGYVNVKPLLIEAAELSGLDPAEVIVDPGPPPPEEPNISYRFSGKDDLMNPLVVALLMKHKQMPTPEELDQAKRLLEAVGLPANSPQPPAPSPGPGGPAGPEGSEPLPPGSEPSPGGPAPGGPEANPDWQLAPKIAQRSEDMQGG